MTNGKHRPCLQVRSIRAVAGLDVGWIEEHVDLISRKINYIQTFG